MLFPLHRDFSGERVDPEKQQAGTTCQQALSKLSQGVISNAFKVKVDTKEKDLNVKIAPKNYLSSTP